jgi:hypothetical protein
MKRSTPGAHSETEQRVELRREPRLAADGEIRFSFRDAGFKAPSRQVRGRLMDRSKNGFRAQHECAELTAGQVVQYRIPGITKGKARVVWTRILGTGVETGFLILPEDVKPSR